MSTDQHLGEFPEQPRQPYPGQPYPPAHLPPIIINNTATAAASAGGGPWRRTNHLLHGILTLCTGGLWAPVWIYVTWRNNRDNRTNGMNVRVH